MNLLADENVDAPIVSWLRKQGYDVYAIAESSPGMTDESVLELACAQNRVLLTFDRDFGELVYLQRRQTAGIVFMRLRAKSADELVQKFQNVWPNVATKAPDHFVVVSNDSMRVRPLSLK